MYYYVFFLFIIQPLLEYGAHRKIHLHKDYDILQIHKTHHKVIHQKKYNNSIFKNILSSILTLPICYAPYGEYVWLSFFKYQLAHLILHKYPFVFPQLSKFHAIHHVNPKVNYTITAMWPDKVFGTYKN
jgi:sterol desaturase/sphingolipid hydroxylase (fatty acid hydroxylase superfamily)